MGVTNLPKVTEQHCQVGVEPVSSWLLVRCSIDSATTSATIKLHFKKRTNNSEQTYKNATNANVLLNISENVYQLTWHPFNKNVKVIADECTSKTADDVWVF